MHLIDVSSRAQEFDDPNLMAWHQFYEAVINAVRSPRECVVLLSSALSVRRFQEEDESKMAFHAFLLLSRVLTNSRPVCNWYSMPLHIRKHRRYTLWMPLVVRARCR